MKSRYHPYTHTHPQSLPPAPATVLSCSITASCRAVSSFGSRRTPETPPASIGILSCEDFSVRVVDKIVASRFGIWNANWPWKRPSVAAICRPIKERGRARENPPSIRIVLPRMTRGRLDFEDIRHMYLTQEQSRNFPTFLRQDSQQGSQVQNSHTHNCGCRDTRPLASRN